MAWVRPRSWNNLGGCTPAIWVFWYIFSVKPRCHGALVTLNSPVTVKCLHHCQLFQPALHNLRNVLGLHLSGSYSPFLLEKVCNHLVYHHDISCLSSVSQRQLPMKVCCLLTCPPYISASFSLLQVSLNFFPVHTVFGLLSPPVHCIFDFFDFPADKRSSTSWSLLRHSVEVVLLMPFLFLLKSFFGSGLINSNQLISPPLSDSVPTIDCTSSTRLSRRSIGRWLPTTDYTRWLNRRSIHQMETAHHRPLMKCAQCPPLTVPVNLICQSPGESSLSVV